MTVNEEDNAARLALKATK